MEFLRDPVWQFIGVILTLITLFLSILFYLRQRTIKSLSYEIISDTPLFTVQEDVKDKIQVFFNSKQIDDARLIVLRIWNSGKASILSADFEHPIKFSFGAKAEILDTTIIVASPESIKDEILLKIELGEVSLYPLLLNKEDSIRLKFLISNSKEKLHVSARIAGIKQLTQIKFISEQSKLPLSVYFTCSVTAIFVLSLILFLITWINFFGFVCLIIFIMAILYVIGHEESKKADRQRKFESFIENL